MQRYLDIALSAANQAAELVRAAWADPRQVSLKDDESLVTELDTACERAIRGVLERLSPECAILGEEEGSRPEQAGAAQWWYVDPIDGTTNLAHHFPWCAISIALLREGQPHAAVVLNPVQRLCFTAVRGGGARLDGKALRVSTCSGLERALLATGFSVGPHRTGEVDNLPLFASVLPQVHSVRRAGSAALDLASVAAGWFDGFWELGLHAWDTPAGWLLVEEAGGRVSRLDGSVYDAHVPEIVATNGALHEPLLALLRGSCSDPLGHE